QVAFAAGFSSVRRFNASFRKRFSRSPSEVRRPSSERSENGSPADAIELRLDYRPPLEWPALLEFLGGRAIEGIERVEDGEYRRVVVLGDHSGSVAVRADPDRPALR